ncbi:peptide ABC transporter substrate-binding protein [Phenylobacterium sp.]|jgi:oligopeptide transport system substrate-binding protein|uniref:peptide ABC transporter substrate-binding protein n=1 Tax=Phenylobacterium sp. TaxID=1871053 RepID=UPI0037C8201D
MARAILFGLLLGAIATGLTGCGGSSSRPTCPAGQSCLLYGNQSEPETLDPAKATGVWETRIIGQLSEGLTRRGADGMVGPGVARSWTVSPDGLVWTFKLRSTKWSDGVPLTAGDFVYGIGRTVSPRTASQSAFLLYPILNAQAVASGAKPLEALGVEAPAPDTVIIRLEHPWPTLPSWTADRTMRPAPRHVIAKLGDGWVKPGSYIGNGPYTLKSWRLGDRIVLRRNPNYWAEPACFEEVAFYPTTDPVTAERQVRNSELDLNLGVQSNRLRYLGRPDQMPEYVRSNPITAITYLPFNLTDVPALRDVRVRRALSMSIDRAFITDKLLAGGQVPATNFLPPGLEDYTSTAQPYWAALTFTQRQAEAKRLLLAAGYGPQRPLALTLKHMSGGDVAVVVPAIQADWAAIGVRVALEQNETQVAYAAYENRDFEIGTAGWISFDALNFLDLLRSSSGGQNYGRYNNPTYDRLVKSAQYEPNDARRRALMGQAEQILLDDAAIAPLYVGSARNLVSPSLTGWIDNPMDFHTADRVCRRPELGAGGVGRTP